MGHSNSSTRDRVRPAGPRTGLAGPRTGPAGRRPGQAGARIRVAARPGRPGRASAAWIPTTSTLVRSVVDRGSCAGMRAAAGPWRRRQGFGCIFFVLFLVVVASIVAAVGSFLSHLGPVPVVIAILGAVAGSSRRSRAGGRRRPRSRHDAGSDPPGGGRRLRGPGREDAIRPRPDPGARPRVRHDDGASRGRRGAAADAAGRRQPRAAHAARRDHRQPRGRHRRRLPGRMRRT